MSASPPALEERVVCLVDALNGLPGIATRASCDGHCMRYPYVDFVADGTAESLSSLGLISRAARSCAWVVVVRAHEPRESPDAYFTLLPADCVGEPEWTGAEVAVPARTVARSVHARDALPRLAERVIELQRAVGSRGC